MLAANGVDVRVQTGGGYTPTPVVAPRHSRVQPRAHAAASPTASSSRRRTTRPTDGGFKYNPPHGGPADTDATVGIEARANALLAEANRGVQRVPSARAPQPPTTRARLRRRPTSTTSATALDLEAVARRGLRIGVDPLGGASVAYWEPIAARYGL